MARARWARRRVSRSSCRLLEPDHRYLSLATYRASGAELATPVWFVSVDGTLYVFTAGDSGKVKRLRRSSRARVAPCNARGTLDGPWQDATAHVVHRCGDDRRRPDRDEQEVRLAEATARPGRLADR